MVRSVTGSTSVTETRLEGDSYVVYRITTTTYSEPPSPVITEEVVNYNYSPYYSRIATALEAISEDLKVIRVSAVGDGVVSKVTITDPGAGYTSEPSISFSDPEVGSDVATASFESTSQTTNTIEIASGETTYRVTPLITHAGSKYRVAPVVTLGMPGSVTSPIKYAASVSVVQGDYVEYNGNYYVVVEQGAGVLGSNGPIHTSDTAQNGTVILRYVGRQATATAILGGGAGTKTVNPYDLLAVASMYSYYINNPNEITALLDAVQKPNGSTDLDRLKLLSNFVNNLPKLP